MQSWYYGPSFISWSFWSFLFISLLVTNGLSMLLIFLKCKLLVSLNLSIVFLFSVSLISAQPFIFFCFLRWKLLDWHLFKICSFTSICCYKFLSFALSVPTSFDTLYFHFHSVNKIFYMSYLKLYCLISKYLETTQFFFCGWVLM